MADNIYFRIFFIIASYLIGSVVFGYVIAKILGKKGFGSVDRPGTAGAGRQYGLKAGIPVFLFDCGKGAAIPLIGMTIGLDMLTIVIASFAVLLGHNWPVFFKFRGGGGVATAMGISASLMPVQFLIVLGASLAIALIYRFTLGKKHKVNPNVVGSLFAILVFPLVLYFFRDRFSSTGKTFFFMMVLVLGIMIIILIKGIILHFIYRKVPTAG